MADTTTVEPPKVAGKIDDNTRQKYLQRWASLKTERQSWFEHGRELSQFLLPRSGRFFLTDRNKGDKRHNSIYDSTATRSVRVLAAGLMAGMTSPARPWFRLGTADKDLMQSAPVKRWLNEVADLMRAIFNKSNTYRALHSVYEELGVFGTAANIILPNFKNVLHNYPQTFGEYAIATDGEGTVNAMYREFEMTVGQAVTDFGLANVSTQVKNAYERGTLEAWFPVMHVIEPRTDRDYSSMRAKQMPWRSCYFESAGNENQLLRESGFKRFPALCPRWATSGGDIYGNSPGMEALGDVKQLQHEQFRKAQGIDFMSLPPVQAPASLKTEGINKLPGGVTYYDSTGPQNVIRNAFDVQLDLGHLLADIQDVRERIKQTLYTDLFLMLQQIDAGHEMTAREIAERHEEKLLMLGPVLERLHNELLNPLIDITFDRIVETGLLPEPPSEMHGQDINIEFVSMLAQAQRAVGVTAVDRLLGTVGSLAQLQAGAGVHPTALDKINVERVVDQYGDMLGVDPDLIRSDDEVKQIQVQRAQAQQKAAAVEQQATQAATAKDMSQAQQVPGDLVNQFSGYSLPVGQPGA